MRCDGRAPALLWGSQFYISKKHELIGFAHTYYDLGPSANLDIYRFILVYRSLIKILAWHRPIYRYTNLCVPSENVL